MALPDVIDAAIELAAAAALGIAGNAIAAVAAAGVQAPAPAAAPPNPQMPPVAFEDVPGYAEQWDAETGVVRRRVLVKWEDAERFAPFVLGDVEAGQGGYLKRYLPQQHPAYPTLWASECRLLEGRGGLGDGPVPLYFDTGTGPNGWAVFEIAYIAPEFPILADGQNRAAAQALAGLGDPPYEINRWVVKERQDADETIEFAGKVFAYEKPNRAGRREPIQAGITRRNPLVQVQYHWICVPEQSVLTAVDWSFDAMGQVNGLPFDGCDAETLLLLAPRMGPRYYTVSGQPVRDVTWSFIHRRYGWNRFWRAGSGKFASVFPQPYRTNNHFSNLFKA